MSSNSPGFFGGFNRRDFLASSMAAAASMVLSRSLRAQGAGLSVRPIQNAVPTAAHLLPLDAVRLTGGPLKKTQELCLANQMRLDPDRMMFYLRQLAGLDPKAQTGYGSWDGPGRNLTGHIAGHYLSGISYMYAATGDERLKQRVDYLVDEMEAVQNKRGNGYIGALMGGGGRGGGSPVDGVELFNQISQGNIRSSGFDLNGMWSPWYVQHKIFAGLRDAHRRAGNKKALEVSVKFATWVESILKPLNEQQLQRMLGTEFGGINESLADIYADTGDKRWLELSDKFEHHAIIDPLANRQDILGGKHGNTQVPKMIGELARYIYSGNKPNGDAAKFFWEQVVYHHSFATGGHGYDEYFGPPDRMNGQVDGTGQRSGDLRTCESCNVYNMIRMTRMLFAIDPNNRYVEFHERALFNHVLGSINFNDGQVCYMVPIGQQQVHEYQGNGFTCCVGSGLESHALHGDGIYAESSDKFWINLFAPSRAESKMHGMKLEMESSFPEADASTVRLTLDVPKEFTILLRRPSWAGEGYTLKVNGAAVENPAKPGNYVELKRQWKTGDTVSFTLPKSLWKDPLPDNKNRAAVMWGPITLAADHGAGGRGGGGGRRGGTSAAGFLSIVGEDPVSKWMKPVEGQQRTWRAALAGENATSLDFHPFYEMSGRRYSVYFDIYSAQDWAQRGGAADPQVLAKQRLEAATVGYAQPGQMQAERDYNFQSEAATVIEGDNPGRRGTKWFSFDLPVDPTHPMTLIVTYSTNEAARREFEVLVDGKQLKAESVTPATPSRFYDVEYVIDADMVKGKSKVTVKFSAVANSEIAGVYGVRMIKGDAQR